MIEAPKKYKPQIVVARYKENVDWILENNWQDRCIVYNKGTDKLSPRLNTTNKPNYPVYGREGETYLYHILSNYKNLPEYTIFTQGDPFEHAPQFIEIIKSLDEYGHYLNCQPLSNQWKVKESVPPLNLVIYDKSLYIHNKYPVYLELLNENLETSMYIDHGWYGSEKSFRRSYNLSLNSKLFPLLPFIYDKLHLINRKPYTGFVKCMFGAIFGVSRDNILQYDRKFYENLYQFVVEYPANGYVLERMWYTIFHNIMTIYNLEHLSQESQSVFGPIQDDEALFLYALIKIMKLQYVVEIGGLRGYSATNFSKAICEQGIVITVDTTPLTPVSNNHKVVTKLAHLVETKDLPLPHIDLVFFDAHDYESQMCFFHNMKNNSLISDNTIIALHDTGTHPNPNRPYQRYISSDNRYGNNGFIHVFPERFMCNELMRIGYCPIHLHVNNNTISNTDIKFRHGLTILSKPYELSN